VLGYIVIFNNTYASTFKNIHVEGDITSSDGIIITTIFAAFSGFTIITVVSIKT